MPKQNHCRGCQIPIARYTRWCSEECAHFVKSISVKYHNYRFAPPELREFILKRDNYKCVYCGTPVTNETANMEHMKPWPKGKTTPRNINTSCRLCNKSKYTSTSIHMHLKHGERKINGTILGRNLQIPP